MLISIINDITRNGYFCMRRQWSVLDPYNILNKAVLYSYSYNLHVHTVPPRTVSNAVRAPSHTLLSP
ncbi:uncharacterized protein YALI1_A07608g [Yarrowia lipolytica]|uniref:Uncharacterized protein n=1 Tax=Yarrowia lipolytica TaxID=4952 RepID=A0A1D8N426_YARLL|nr:hypothetical protein YALI1_A07608g [Yarrowia lipolytica]